MHDHLIVGRGDRPVIGTKNAVLEPVLHFDGVFVRGVRCKEFPAGCEIGVRLPGLNRGAALHERGLGRLYLLVGQSRAAASEHVADSRCERGRVDLLEALLTKAGADAEANHVAHALEVRLKAHAGIGG